MICLAAVAATTLSACATDGARYRDHRYAANGCERDRSNNRAAATVAGAGLGALAGSAIAGNSSNTEGAIAGGVAGAVIGNQLAKGDPCPGDYPRRGRR
jgi:hypothetical protein